MTQKHPLWLITGLQAIASLLMLSPLLVLSVTGFAGNTDALFYSTVLKLVASHMSMWDLHPVWLPEANGGTGSPVMLYYNPLAYQITALLTAPLASVDPMGWKRMAAGMFFAQWFSGIACFFWLKRLASERCALWVSLLYTVFPYKFIYIFLHVNLAQLWALLFLPLLMIAAIDMSKGVSRATAWYGLWLGLLTLTHARTSVAFGAFPLLYALIFTERRAMVAGRLLIAHVLAAGVAAFYILPGLMNLDLVRAGLANLGRMNYADNLSHRDLLHNFHYAVIAALSIGMMLRLPQLKKERGGELWFYIGSLFIITILCLRISKPLWDVLTPLQFLQFPVARLHAPALIAATAMSAIFLDHIGEVRGMRWLYSRTALLLPVAVTAVFTLHTVANTYDTASSIDWDYIERMHKLNVILPPEYLTRWQPEDGFTPEVMLNIGSTPMTRMTEGMGQTVSTFEMPRTLHITALVASELATYRVHQLYLPQWTIDGTDGVHYDQDGLIRLFLSKGEYKLTMTLGRFPGEIPGEVISLLALAAIAAKLLYCKRKPAALTSSA